MRKITVIFGAVLSLVVLVSAMKSATKRVSLASKGIPISIEVPVGASITSGILNGMEMEGVKTLCWEINKDDFSLEVTMDEQVVNQSRKEYVQYSKNVLEMDQSFVGYIETDENGFFAKMNFGGEIEYEFYHVVFVDNHAIEFSTGIGTGDYSIANIGDIYVAAKSAK